MLRLWLGAFPVRRPEQLRKINEFMFLEGCFVRRRGIPRAIDQLERLYDAFGRIGSERFVVRLGPEATVLSNPAVEQFCYVDPASAVVGVSPSRAGHDNTSVPKRIRFFTRLTGIELQNDARKE